MLGSMKSKYLQLPTNEDDSKETMTRSHQTQQSRRFNATYLIVIALTVVLSVTMFIVMGIYLSRPMSTSSESPSLPCGNSSAEARALGCKFDQLMWAWFPPHCPQYKNDEFVEADSDGPWVFYTNPHTKQVALKDDWERALNNEIHLYGQRREHLSHCVFMFMSLARIWETDGKYTSKYAEFEHYEHCGKILLEALRLDPTRFKIETQAPFVAFDQTC